jgi:hypothetical protein
MLHILTVTVHITIWIDLDNILTEKCLKHDIKLKVVQIEETFYLVKQ